MKKYLVLSFLFSLSSIVYSQMAVGEWKAHLSYNDAILTEPGDENVYVLCADMQRYKGKDTTNVTSLFSYDIEDSSIHTYDKVNSLTDNDISYIKYSKLYKTLIIVYNNYNIDLLVNDKDVYNVPDYMNKIMLEDKYLNSVSLYNEYAYLSTNFGIVILNIKKKEISNSYILKKKVYSSIVTNNKIYVATNEGVYAGLLSDNLQDNNNWKLVENIKLNQLVYFDNSIIGNGISSGLYKYNSVNNKFEKIQEGYYSSINTYDDKLIGENQNEIVIFSNSMNSLITQSKNNIIKHFSYSKKHGIYWGSNGSKGLNGYKYNQQNNSFENTISSIIPNSPRRNIFGYMTFTNNRLLISGGSLNYGGITYPGTLMMYENGEWSSFQEEGIKEQTRLEYINLTSIVQDPKDPEHHFASSARQGLYEFKNKKFIKLYDEDNSGLEHITKVQSEFKNYTSVGALKYDKNNNLWMTNGGTTSILKVLKTDGNWIKYSHPDISKQENFIQLMIDSRGWVWATSMWDSGDQVSGFFCFNYNNTLESTNDDQNKFYKKVLNQDGTEVLANGIQSIMEDKNGAIWVGTGKGPLIINNPTKVFDTNFYCTQIKIPRNNGTNNADFLLINESITAMCLDGANRKWIGTERNGIYLISEDGLETIHHFNTDNSPILSNTIISIAINPNTGEVFIGTDKGLVSYRSDATEGSDTFSESAHAFPNPVKSDYTGIITVTGLVKDSDVKITDSNGNLIYTGKSTGGQFTWNGKNINGKRVASGVYFVLAANAEGKEGITTKILMIK